MLTQRQFMEAYEMLADPLFRHCYYRISNRERARELMQEAFLRAWKYNIDGKEIRSVKTFLYRVVNNLVIDEYRKKKDVSLEQHAMGSSADPYAPPSEQLVYEPGVDHRTTLMDHIDGKQALEAVEQLDGPYKEVIIMRFVDGLSPREIAKIVDETPNVVSVRIHRAIAQLRKVLLQQVNQ
ncbi:RNA polymerase sigma factor [Candidatus Uhrbacteria bacterium]|nr:RNA polymerase sigma factor [Candidatus Uhrbacteria bacterium]